MTSPPADSVLSAVVHAAPTGIVATDDRGKIVLVNPLALGLFGYSEDEMIGSRIETLMPERYRGGHLQLRAEFMNAAESPRPMGSGRDLFALRKDGTEFPVEIGLAPFNSENGKMVVASIVDITERKELEQKVLEISEAEQRRIGQDIHDDLCQQLASIGCLTKVVEQQLKAIYEDGAESLARIGEMISQANVRAREIAHGLAPSMLQNEGLPGVLRDLAERTQKSYQVNCVADCPDSISLVDPKITTHLYRIAQEAIGNAVRHAEPTNVKISLQEENGVLSLSVCDDGIGITDPTRSTGMGLLTMAHRAQLLGGEFDLHSSPGGGTKIRIDIKTK
ncbi:MAG: PAS domain S-box protein [Verrucomicrobiota bacterium]